MSWWGQEWARKVKTGSSTDKAVLLYIGALADNDDVCWPGHKRIASDLEMGVTTVRDSLRRLRDKGFIEIIVDDRDDGRRQGTNTYRLLLPAALVGGGATPNIPDETVSDPDGGVSDPDRGVSASRQLLTTTNPPAKEKTSSSHGRASRAVPTKIVEVAREAEAGTLRKRSKQEPERTVDAGHATQSGWPKRKQRDRKPATRRQRVAGVAQRFTKDARAAFPGEAMQVNLKAVDGALWKAAQEAPDVTWEQLDRAREMFFEQAASLHHPGVPAWQNFLYRIPRLVEAARREGGAGAEALQGDELASWLDEDDSVKRGPMTQEEIAKWLD